MRFSSSFFFSRSFCCHAGTVEGYFDCEGDVGVASLGEGLSGDEIEMDDVLSSFAGFTVGRVV